MTGPAVEPFVPRLASAADLSAWCRVFGDGQGEMSGGAPSAAGLAEYLLAEQQPVMRWAVRAGSGVISGVAELRPAEQGPEVGFLRLYVARSARRHGLGAALLARVVADAVASGSERLRATVPAGGPGEPFARGCSGQRVVLRLERQDQRLDREGVLDRCRALAVCPDPA